MQRSESEDKDVWQVPELLRSIELTVGYDLISVNKTFNFPWSRCLCVKKKWPCPSDMQTCCPKVKWLQSHYPHCSLWLWAGLFLNNLGDVSRPVALSGLQGLPLSKMGVGDGPT